MIEQEKTVAIVVSYNIEKKELMEHINTYINYVDKVIIADNSDRDMQLNLIEDNRIIYLGLGGNKGIAYALNQGIRYAINQGYKFALTMDQDSKFQNNLIDEFCKYYDEDIIIYSPNYLISRKKQKQYKKDTKELYWTMTSGNLLNLENFEMVGEFREDFFIDGVDYEYCIRARKAGYKILQCNNAKLNHNPGIEKVKNLIFFEYKYGYMSPTRMYYQVRNLSAIVKEYKSLRALAVIFIKFAKIILLFENKIEFLKMFKKGIIDFKNNNYGKLK